MKKIVLSTFLLSAVIAVSAQEKILSPEELVQLQTDKYNSRDLDGFMAEFASDVKMYDFRTGEVTQYSFEEIRKTFKELFEISPNLHSSSVKRIVYDNIVIEHERIDGRRGSTTPVEFVVISTIESGKIAKVTYIRKK
jgi:hypothetical protein